ncbi:MAG: tetratricopeptide repeat protein [Candidatus Aquicultorales bacterium]
MGRHAKPSDNPLAKGRFWAVLGIILAVALTAGVTTYFVWPRGEAKPGGVDVKKTVTKEELVAGYQSGKLKDVLPKFAAYLSDNPGDEETRSLYASALVLSGDLEEAVKEYKAIVAKSPGDADALYQGGVALAQLGRTKDAIDFLNKAIAAKSGVMIYHAELARLLGKDGHHDAALSAWQQALSLTPEDDRYRATIFAEMAALYIAKGQPGGASEIIQNGLSIDPENEYLKALSSQIMTIPSNATQSGGR